MKVYSFDIDGTICTFTDGDYEKAIPFREVIKRVNCLYDEGNRVVFYTGRGSSTGIDWRDLTTRQLEEWGVKYHELYMGKPYADLYIDDRAVNTAEWLAKCERDEKNGAK